MRSNKHILCAGLAASLLAACSQAEQADPVAEGQTAAQVAPQTGGASNENAAPAPQYDGPIPMPVKVGSDGPQMDACGIYAEVGNFDPSGEDYLSVRDAPDASTKERDRLAEGKGVSICASANGWSGIVYAGEGQDLAECGVGSPVASEQNYTGPCRSGWVSSRYLRQIAG